VLRHAAKAGVGDELTWRGRHVARAAPQVRSPSPRRPTWPKLVEHGVWHCGHLAFIRGIATTYGSNSTGNGRSGRPAAAADLLSTMPCSRLQAWTTESARGLVSLRRRASAAQRADPAGCPLESSFMRWLLLLPPLPHLSDTPRWGAAASCGRTPHGRGGHVQGRAQSRPQKISTIACSKQQIDLLRYVVDA
jgi:hypothetical protein